MDTLFAEQNSASSTRRRPTVDGLVFQWMGMPRPTGLGMPQTDIGIAGKILKGRGNSWTPWTLGALIAAYEGETSRPVFTARRICKGNVPQWAEQRADALLKKFAAECFGE